MYSNIPSGRIYTQCSKCERLFPVNMDGKSIRPNCKLHKVKGGNAEIVVQHHPLKVKILIIIVIIQQKNPAPAQFFDCRFRVFFLFFISQGIASND